MYLAPRAPTDAWNMWHKPHIGKFFARLIQDAMVFEDVNPNRVYLLGYSAGGDGVFQMAPRMADSLAAAAMMAGHPNGVSAMNLRNIGFTIHMGENDRAHKRNLNAEKWKVKLADLAKADPGGYEHEVVIQKGMGHWMKRKDAVALPWMAKFNRNPLPQKVSWRQSSVVSSDFYWLGVEPGKEKRAATIVATREKNKFNIESVEKVDTVHIRLNAQMVDFDKPIEVSYGGETKTFENVRQTPEMIYQSIEKRGDPGLIFSAQVKMPIPQEMEKEAEK